MVAKSLRYEAQKGSRKPNCLSNVLNMGCHLSGTLSFWALPGPFWSQGLYSWKHGGKELKGSLSSQVSWPPAPQTRKLARYTCTWNVPLQQGPLTAQWSKVPSHTVNVNSKRFYELMQKTGIVMGWTTTIKQWTIKRLNNPWLRTKSDA